MTRKITVKTKKRRSRSDRALAAEMFADCWQGRSAPAQGAFACAVQSARLDMRMT